MSRSGFNPANPLTIKTIDEAWESYYHCVLEDQLAGEGGNPRLLKLLQSVFFAGGLGALRSLQKSNIRFSHLVEHVISRADATANELEILAQFRRDRPSEN